MRTVSIVSQKGGAGKTTLAVHLAAAAVDAGYVSLLVDTDPQASASRWAHWRKGREPDVIDCGAPSLLAGKLAKAATLGADLAVIDTPPHADALAREAVKLADLVLIPCRPRAFDLAALEATAELIRSCGVKAAVVFMAGPRQATIIYRDAASLLGFGPQGLGLEIAPVRLPDRAAYHQSVAEGRLASETEPAGKAAAEVAALWAWTCEQVHLSSAPARSAG